MCPGFSASQLLREKQAARGLPAFAIGRQSQTQKARTSKHRVLLVDAAKANSSGCFGRGLQTLAPGVLSTLAAGLVGHQVHRPVLWGLGWLMTQCLFDCHTTSKHFARELFGGRCD